jgi:hypothetical protein
MSGAYTPQPGGRYIGSDIAEASGLPALRSGIQHLANAAARPTIQQPDELAAALPELAQGGLGALAFVPGMAAEGSMARELPARRMPLADVVSAEEPVTRLPVNPMRELGANALPIAEPQPFRRSFRGGTADLNEAAAMRSGASAPDAGGGGGEPAATSARRIERGIVDIPRTVYGQGNTTVLRNPTADQLTRFANADAREHQPSWLRNARGNEAPMEGYEMRAIRAQDGNTYIIGSDSDHYQAIGGLRAIGVDVGEGARGKGWGMVRLQNARWHYTNVGGDVLDPVDHWYGQRRTQTPPTQGARQLTGDVAEFLGGVESRSWSGLPSAVQRAMTGPGEIREMPLSDLTGTQRRVNADFPNAATRSDDAPLVFRLDGKNYVQDGHHHLAAAAARGSQTARVRFIDLDAAARSTQAPPNGGALPPLGAAALGVLMKHNLHSNNGGLHPRSAEVLSRYGLH